MDNSDDSNDMLKLFLSVTNDGEEEKTQLHYEAAQRRTQCDGNEEFILAPHSNNQSGIILGQSNPRAMKSVVENDVCSGVQEDLDSRNNRFETSTSCGKVCDILKSVPAKNINNGLKAKTGAQFALSSDVYTDPFFKIRVLNPLISNKSLEERMQGRSAVLMSGIKQYVKGILPDTDWVTAGALVSKTMKTSQKGTQFSIWTVSDLHHDLKTISLFLFSGAHKELWKTAVGTVIGILNPKVLEKKEGGKEEVSLSIDNAQRVMIFGLSKDFGFCKSKCKSGEKCTSFVNSSRCEFCVFHVRVEYKKCSKRSELQSNFAGRGLVGLRNKVLGNNEVFYAGKSYTAQKSKSLVRKDNAIIASLSSNETPINSGAFQKKTSDVIKAAACRVDADNKQRRRDFDLLKKLNDNQLNSVCKNNSSEILDMKCHVFQSRDVTLKESKNNALGVIANLKAKQTNCAQKSKNNSDSTTNSNMDKEQNGDIQKILLKMEGVHDTKKQGLRTNPQILQGSTSLTGLSQNIDLDTPISFFHKDRARQNAVKYVRHAGPIAKANPMSTRGSKRKQPLDVDLSEIITSKKLKIEENEAIKSRFREIMATTSKHTNLIDEHDNKERDSYFVRQEARERMEDKMSNTYKVSCKSVSCLTCKYTAFSASEYCKQSRHPLRVADATKRFFKCASCGNRTVTLNVVPMETCSRCGIVKWERCSMIADHKPTNFTGLSIRGGEERYIGGTISNANVNLLIPDEGAI